MSIGDNIVYRGFAGVVKKIRGGRVYCWFNRGRRWLRISQAVKR